MLDFRLPADIEERLDALAKATGRSKSFYAREAILQHGAAGLTLAGWKRFGRMFAMEEAPFTSDRQATMA